MVIHKYFTLLDPSSHVLTAASRHLVRYSWQTIRLAMLAILVVLEPLVTLVLNGIALLGILMCLFFEYVVQLPNFPFWLMMGISVGSALSLVGYYLLVRILSR